MMVELLMAITDGMLMGIAYLKFPVWKEEKTSISIDSPLFSPNVLKYNFLYHYKACRKPFNFHTDVICR